MLKKIAVFLLSLLLLAFAAFCSLLWFANTDAGRRFISEKGSDALGRELRYTGKLQWLRAWPLTLRVTGVELANMEDGRAEEMLDIGKAEVSIRLLPLLAGKVHLPYLYLENSEVNLERTAERANWDFGDKDEPPRSDEPSRLALGKLYLYDSHLTYYDVPQRIDLALAGHTAQDSIVLEGDGTYLGQPFGLHFIGGELLSARTAEPYPVNLTVTVGNTTAEAKGILTDPVHFGGLDVDFHLKGADAAELFPLFGIALPPTPPYDIRGQLTYDADIWSFMGFKGRMGNSDIGGDVEWNRAGERPKLTAKFVSRKLDLVDLGPLIGLAPKQQASAEQAQYAEKREESPYLIPDVPLDISRLAAMDADVSYTGHEVVSPYLPLDDFFLHVTLDNRLLHIDPVKFGTADGDVIAHLTVNARGEPVAIDSDFSFSRLSLARLTEGVSESLPMTEKAEGLIGGTAKLSGTGKSLKEMLASADGAVGIGMEGGQISNLLIELVGLDVAQGLGFLLAGDEVVPVRCIIGDFAVEDGLMQSRAVVIDTADTNIQGRGTIDLGSEKMDIRIVPKPKDATIAALRVPLRVEGTLKHPDIVIEKGPLLAKGAGATALGVLLTPIAGLLALAETGLGEDSNCARLVSDMNAHTGTSEATDNVPTNTGAPRTEPAPADTQEPLPATDADAADTHAGTGTDGNRPPPLQPDIVVHPGEATPVKR